MCYNSSQSENCCLFFNDFEGELANAITSAVHDTINNPKIISISYGLWEEGGWTKRAFYDVNQACIDAGLMNVTICVASGDQGSSCEVHLGDGNEINDDKVHVAFPASCPNVLTCGGTNFETSKDGTVIETVWNENDIIDENGNHGGAGGGGISEIFDIPPYQNELRLPPSLNDDGRIGRGVPDVSGYAASNPGIDVIVDNGEGGVGGTSAVAPLWAGLISLINQGVGKPVDS